jgi:hypothetical protein
MSEKTDPTWHWPQEWRDEYARQNKLLGEDGEDLLTPREFLQCRYEDRAEQREHDEVTRLLNWSEVYHMVLKVQAEREAAADSIHENAEACVKTARHWADLAYPPVKP